jgi:Pyruvate/2-oxoacid:ferredoxin oxidoreductase delta subunit
VVLGPREEMTANREALDEAIEEGVRFEWMARPVALQATPHPDDEAAIEAIRTMFAEEEADRPRARVVGVECVRLKKVEGDGNAGYAPAPGDRFLLPADTVLTALGEEPDLAFLPADITRKGYLIKVDAFGHTSRKGVFAGGDITGEAHTVAHSLGSGKRAAIGIDLYLRSRAGETVQAPDEKALRYAGIGNMSVTRWRGDDPVARTNELNELVPFEMLNTAHFARVPSIPDRHRPANERRDGFLEADLGLGRDEALAEAKRCFNCGVCNDCGLCMIFCPDVAIKPHASGHGFSLSYKYCKGCGVCVEECPRGAMTMTREGL